MPPPPHSTSTLGEVHASVLPLGSGQRLCLGMTPFASLPGPQVRRACDRAREIWRAQNVARNMLEPSGDDCSVTLTAGAQAVSRGYMPSECLSPVAAIKTNHMVPMDGTAHRHSGSENLLWFGQLSNVTDRGCIDHSQGGFRQAAPQRAGFRRRFQRAGSATHGGGVMHSSRARSAPLLTASIARV